MYNDMTRGTIASIPRVGGGWGPFYVVANLNRVDGF